MNAIKSKMMTESLAQKTKIVEDAEQEYDLAAIEFELKPFPDLLNFYKTVLDQILAQVKAAKNTDCKPVIKGYQLDSDNNLKEMTKNWNNFAVDKDEEPQSKDNDLSKKESNVGKKFGNDLFPIIQLPYDLPKAKPNPILEPKPHREIPKVPKPMAQQKTRPKEPTETMTPPMMGSGTDRRPNTRPNFKTVENFKSVPVNQSFHIKSGIKQSIGEPLENTSKSSVSSRIGSTTASTATLYNDSMSLSNGISQKMKVQDAKIVDLLNEKFPNLCEDLLIESIEKTREMLKKFGRKGFSGMRLSEIVEKVCAYIRAEEVKPKLDPTQRNMCSLCSGLVDSAIEKIVLSCGHVFHTDCLESWSHNNTRCPNCLPKANN